MHPPRSDASSPTRADSKQRLRVRRFLLASTFSLLYLVVLAVFHTQGKLDRATLLQAAVIVAALVATFFLLFRFRLNVRFPDPSLTGFQVLAAVLTMLFVVYHAPATRLVFAAFFFVALMFGMLRSSGAQLGVLGSVSLVCFGLVTWLRYIIHGDIEVLRLDMLQLIVTAVAFPWFVFIGTRVASLKEADRRKDHFLATLAHELRNPLAPIRAGVQILRLTVADTQTQPVLPMMERQLQHMTRLLDDLLDVSRITRGKITLHLEHTDLQQAIQAAVEACRPLIEEMGHDLTVSLPPEPMTLDADPVRLTQIVSNLLNNAAKYTPPRGSIALHAQRRDGEVEVCVSDNGIGIPPDRLSSIFEMFTQIETPASRLKGLGIGLSLVKGLVELHGGTIEARSDGLGHGSEFRVWLPTRSARGAVPAAPPSVARPGTRSKILVVDDNRDAAGSLAMVLELMGHEVRVAHDGEEAVRLAAEFGPRIVLLDLGMPGLDGYEVCRRIRKQRGGKEMKLLAVTGWGQDEDRRKSAAAGFDAHLVKPVSPETLVELLGELPARV